jgi:hypothetical protein
MLALTYFVFTGLSTFVIAKYVNENTHDTGAMAAYAGLLIWMISGLALTFRTL